ncbi:putative angiomotin [Operophtera brumata]|uniref:Putative angiomotin n=1 Tax=Operophtera brumata TaxID=104452 RepID=A0A0L7KSP5_OPEBR|nr:putative angiomotin [Operophtera brumata]
MGSMRPTGRFLSFTNNIQRPQKPAGKCARQQPELAQGFSRRWEQQSKFFGCLIIIIQHSHHPQPR